MQAEEDETLAYAVAYHDELVAYAKANPEILEGMHVMVYGNEEDRPFLGYGVIDHTWWSPHYEQYQADVLMIDRTWQVSVLACNLKRYYHSNSVRYALMKTRMIKGGMYNG